MHYKIDPESKSAPEGMAPLKSPSECPLAEWRFKVSHFNPTDGANLQASVSSASAASAEAEAKSSPRDPKLLTFLYAIKISGQNNDIILTDSNLNKVVNKTFNLMADLLLNYDLKEIIFINETNVFFSGYNIDMLPEIKDRFTAKIKLCENHLLKQKLSIVDFSDIANITENEALRISLYKGKKIPLIMGFREGAGGMSPENIDPQFKSLFSLARFVDNASMVSINRLSMSLIKDKTLLDPNKFTENGTNFSNVVLSAIRSITPKPAASPSDAPLFRLSSSPSASIAKPLSTPTGTLKFAPRSASLSSLSESHFLSEPFGEWPLERESSYQISNTPNQDSSSMDYSTQFVVMSSPFTNDSVLPPAPRWESLSLCDFDPTNDRLIYRNSSSLSLRNATQALASRSTSSMSSTLHRTTPGTSSPEVSPIIMTREFDSAIQSPIPTHSLFSNIGKQTRSYTNHRPAPLLLPLSSSIYSPIAELETPMQAQKSDSFPSSTEDKPKHKHYLTKKCTNTPSSSDEPITHGTLNVGEGILIFSSYGSFFLTKHSTTETTNIKACPSLT